MPVSNFGRNIKALREAKGLTQTELADMLGVSLWSVSGWEAKGRLPRQETLTDIAARFNVSTDDLVKENGYYAKARNGTPILAAKASDTFLPLVGTAPAGEPKEAIEYASEKLWCPPEYCADNNFYIQVKGDSMNRALPDGSFVLIDTSQEVKSGDIALVKVNGDEATIKRVRITEGLLILEPESTNESHRRRIIDATDPNAPEVRLIGRVAFAIVYGKGAV